MPDLYTAMAALYAPLSWLPSWLLSLIIVTIAILAAVAAHSIVAALVKRALAGRDDFWRSLIQRTRRPARLAFITVAVAAAVSVAPMSDVAKDTARHGLLITFIALIGLATATALDIAAALYMRRFHVEAADNLVARKHLTQVRILRRALAVLIAIITLAFALMTIDGVRQWGVSLLAAGGAAGIIVGLALQPLLTNLIAGIQIAITQPIRLDDAVIVENEWGNVEEIGSTYVVVRLWDWRRMVVPLSYFIQTPFQNWTRETSALIGTAMLYVDHAAPIPAMRTKLEEIAGASPLWDGKVVNLAVTDVTEASLQVRCLVSAANSGDAFDLRTEVREKMMAYLAEQHPQALVHRRFGGQSAAPAAEMV